MGKCYFKGNLIGFLILLVGLDFCWAQSQSSEFKLDAIRFFEGGKETPSLSDQKAATQFHKKTTRFMYCKVHFTNLLYKIRTHNHDVTWRYFDPQGKLFGEINDEITMKYEWDTPAICRALGWEEPGNYSPGTYYVHILVDGEKIGQDKFTIVDNDSALLADKMWKAWEQEIRGSDETSSRAQNSDQMQFQFDRAQSGIGGIFQAETPKTGSSEKMLAAAFQEIKQYFEKGPVGVSGFSDVSGLETQVLFQANYKGNNVVGLATALIDSKTQQTVIKFIFNQPERLNSELQKIARQAGATSGRTVKNPVESLNWNWQNTPEGASRLKLPDGWQISGSNAQGMVAAKGLHGSVAFGLYFYIYTPAHLAASLNPLNVIAPYCDPVTAFLNVLPKAVIKTLYEINGRPAPKFANKIIESTPVAGPTGSQSAMIHFDSQIANADGTRIHNQGLATVITAPTGADQWMLYYSEITSPVNSFNQNFPVLWEIWKSWKVSDAVHQQRIDNALKSLNEANQIYQQAMQERDRVMEDSFSDWDEYIRGYRYIEDTDNGRLYDADLHLAPPLVAELNDNAGYQRFREVPMREFNKEY